MTQCKGTTKAGTRCRRTTTLNTEFCAQHTEAVSPERLDWLQRRATPRKRPTTLSMPVKSGQQIVNLAKGKARAARRRALLRRRGFGSAR